LLNKKEDMPQLPSAAAIPTLPYNFISSPPLPAFSNSANTVLLFNLSTQKLTYVSLLELEHLKTQKRVWSIKVPPGKRKVDTHVADTLLGEGYWGSVWLPVKVVLGRLVGWWDRVYVAEGLQDV
jgi:hypothetical protein